MMFALLSFAIEKQSMTLSSPEVKGGFASAIQAWTDIVSPAIAETAALDQNYSIVIGYRYYMVCEVEHAFTEEPAREDLSAGFISCPLCAISGYGFWCLAKDCPMPKGA